MWECARISDDCNSYLSRSTRISNKGLVSVQLLSSHAFFGRKGNKRLLCCNDKQIPTVVSKILNKQRTFIKNWRKQDPFYSQKYGWPFPMTQVGYFMWYNSEYFVFADKSTPRSDPCLRKASYVSTVRLAPGSRIQDLKGQCRITMI